MPRRIEEFTTGDIYHVIVRGVDGRQIFMDDEDRWRGIFSLYEFNNSAPVTIRRQRELRKKFKSTMVTHRFPTPAGLGGAPEDRRDKLADILAFVFMPNHVHMLLRQLKADGVSALMQKIGSGYTNFFNSRYSRKGHLFQGAFQARHISGGEYLKTAFVYVHANPLSTIEPGWKEKGIKDPAAAVKFLEEYRWSSYMDYLGKKNFPSITEREFMTKIFVGPESIKRHVDKWIDYKTRAGDC